MISASRRSWTPPPAGLSRLKSNTPLTIVETLPVPADAAGILSDQIGFLLPRMKYAWTNPMAQAVREIKVKTETGKLLRIVTNDLDAPAAKIAAFQHAVQSLLRMLVRAAIPGV